MGSPREFQELLEFMEEHRVKPQIHSEYILDTAVEAMEALKTGSQVGKVVILH